MIGPILFIIGIVFFIGSYIKQLTEEIEKIKGNCNFDKKFTAQIRRDIEILMNEVHTMKHGSGSGLKILIFDDETESTALIAEMIRKLKPGCKIHTSDNITTALYHLNFSNINTVFADNMHNHVEYGTILNDLIHEQKIKCKFILYSAAPKPDRYTGVFLNKMDIMKNPDLLKEYL